MRRFWIGLLLFGGMSFGLLGCSHITAEERGGDAVGYCIDGDRLLTAGDIPAAIQKYQLAVRTDPTSWQNHRALALGYERAKKYSAAVSEYRVILKLNDQAIAKKKFYNPASVSFGHYWLSQALKHAGKRSEAKQEARLALQIAESDQKHNKKIAKLAITLRKELGK